MFNAKILAIATLGTAAALGMSFYAGFQSGSNSEIAAHMEILARAQSKIAESTKLQQQEINNALAKQYEAQSAINERLDADFTWLRDRTSASVPRPAGTSCEAAHGSELAREHAEFLVRYAAKAAEQDAGLAACYAALDAVQASYERCKLQ